MKSERISPFWVNGYQPFSAIDGYKDHIYISGNMNDNTSGWRKEGIAFYAYLY